MGMSLSSQSNSYVELYSKPTSQTIAGSAGTLTFGETIAIPSDLQGTIYEAYLDFFVPWWTNDYAGVNRIDGNQVIQVDDSANTGWLSAIDIDSSSLYAGSQRIDTGGTQVFAGDVDIKARATKGETIDFQWLNAKALQNNIVIRNVYFRLRIIRG